MASRTVEHRVFRLELTFSQPTLTATHKRVTKRQPAKDVATPRRCRRASSTRRYLRLAAVASPPRQSRRIVGAATAVGTRTIGSSVRGRKSNDPHKIFLRKTDEFSVLNWYGEMQKICREETFRSTPRATFCGQDALLEAVQPHSEHP